MQFIYFHGPKYNHNKPACVVLYNVVVIVRCMMFIRGAYSYRRAYVVRAQPTFQLLRRHLPLCDYSVVCEPQLNTQVTATHFCKRTIFSHLFLIQFHLTFWTDEFSNIKKRLLPLFIIDCCG